MSTILEDMVKPLSPKQVFERIAQGGVEVIDVREPHEWVDGHVPSARLLPLGQFRQNPKALTVEQGHAVVFVCAAGVRSETAARLSLQHGFKDVYNLTGGTRAWVKAGLPLDHESAVTAAE
ncbi:MAG TPA: rhodanese-like domain-containing protein [Polyangiaceae bacterium]|jgi:rhodanese-related sulfurtransferase|nr:rhodanese-like domain-containing protein [Polyangiaceae bacterium]